MKELTWTEQEPTTPGWYWLREKHYAGSEEFSYQGLRTVYVEIRQEIVNGKTSDPYPVAYAALGRHDEPQGKLKEFGLSPQWAGPIHVPSPTK